jgi:hypothetical protein
LKRELKAQEDAFQVVLSYRDKRIAALEVFTNEQAALNAQVLESIRILNAQINAFS